MIKVLYELENILEIIKSTYPFPVDFEQTWQWLGLKNRKRGERLLSTYFIEGIDFTHLQGKSFTYVNKKKNFYKSNCFKLRLLKSIDINLK